MRELPAIPAKHDAAATAATQKNDIRRLRRIVVIQINRRDATLPALDSLFLL